MRVVHQRPKLHRRHEVKGLAYAPDGRFLLAGIERRFRDVWDLTREGRLLAIDLFDPAAEPAEFSDRGFLDVAWRPGGGALAVTGSQVIAVDEDFETSRRFRLEHVGGLVVPPTGDGNDEGEADGHCWIVRTRHGGGGLYRLPLAREVEFRPTVELRDAAFVMQSLAIRGGDGLAAIGGNDGLLLRRLDRDDAPRRAAQSGWIRQLAFSPDGRVLAAVSGWRIVLWEVERTPLRMIAELRGHTKEVTGIAFTPDGRWLLSTSLDETVRLWNPDTGTAGGCYDWGLGALRSVACAPDGMTAAVGGSGRKAIAVFDLD